MNQDLEKLIQVSASTGVVSEKARATIAAKADAMGIAADEVDIYIEAAVNQNSKRINEIDDRVTNIEHQEYVKKWSQKRRVYMVYLAPVIVVAAIPATMMICLFLDSPLSFGSHGSANEWLWLILWVLTVGAYFYYANRFFKKKLSAPFK